MDEDEIRLRATLAGVHEAHERLTDAVRLARAGGMTIAQIGTILGTVSEVEVHKMLLNPGMLGPLPARSVVHGTSSGPSDSRASR
jgi:hypothetical protein